MNARTRLIIPIAAVAVVAFGVGGYVALQPAPSVAVVEPTEIPKEAAPEPVVAPLTFAAVGDSITVWIEGNEVNSWTTYANRDGVVFSGEGWARGGTGIEQMRDNTVPITADVLVIVAGTNYVGGPMPISERLTLLDGVVANSHARAVVISAVPPHGKFPELGAEWNVALEQHAAAMGWPFVNPWAAMTTPEQTWMPEYTIDGIHPNQAGATGGGNAIHDFLLAEYR
jgi:lysophospholipase L1-like esterase